MAHPVEELYDELESEAANFRAVVATSRQEFMDVLHGRVNLPEGFPDHTTTARLIFRKVEKRIAQLQELTNDLLIEADKMKHNRERSAGSGR